jgi:hypothetical protein
MVTLELHPRLEEDLPALIKEYLESERLLRVIGVATGATLMTTDLPYVSSSMALPRRPPQPHKRPPPPPPRSIPPKRR